MQKDYITKQRGVTAQQFTDEASGQEIVKWIESVNGGPEGYLAELTFDVDGGSFIMIEGVERRFLHLDFWLVLGPDDEFHIVNEDAFALCFESFDLDTQAMLDYTKFDMDLVMNQLNTSRDPKTTIVDTQLLRALTDPDYYPVRENLKGLDVPRSVLANLFDNHKPDDIRKVIRDVPKAQSDDEFTNKAIRIVCEHLLKRGVSIKPNEVKISSFTKALQNWKALLTTTYADSLYFEVTYNGDRQEAYLDTYQKQNNEVISDIPTSTFKD